MSGPCAAWLADGRRLHLNHGPIDLIVEAFGEEGERAAACRQASERFETILTELVEELPLLRQPSTAGRPRGFRSSTAQRMEAAACALADGTFVTPMAGVAGSVADEILAAMVSGRRLSRAYVNNGGDIAFHLTDGEHLSAAIVGTGKGLADRVEIGAREPVRGIATSGRHGRSLSLGIADAVTVLAPTAALADVAATLIANAVDLPGHPEIARRPASGLDSDSDLGDRFVTVSIGLLSPGEIDQALERGAKRARGLVQDGLIRGAILYLGGRETICPGGTALATAKPRELADA